MKKMNKEVSEYLNKKINLNKLRKAGYDKKSVKKYIKQRIRRGYSDLDLWDLDSYLSTILYNALKDFIERDNGFPTKGFVSYESYQTYLKEIVKNLDIYHTYRITYRNSENTTEQEKYKEALKCFDEAWNKLGAVFHSLWL